MGTRNLLYVWVSASVAGEKKSDHCIPGGKNLRQRKRLSWYSTQGGRDDGMVCWGRWKEDWWKRERGRRSDSVSNSPAVFCTGYDPHRPLSISHHHFLCQSCATSICVPWLKTSISDGTGRGVRSCPYTPHHHPSPCLSTLLLHVCPASSVLFCCQSLRPAPLLFLSFPSTSCLPFPWRIHLPISSVRNLTPAFKWEINKSVCESRPRSLSLSLFAYSLAQSHTHTHTNTVTYTVICLPSHPTNTAHKNKSLNPEC